MAFVGSLIARARQAAALVRYCMTSLIVSTLLGESSLSKEQRAYNCLQSRATFKTQNGQNACPIRVPLTTPSDNFEPLKWGPDCSLDFYVAAIGTYQLNNFFMNKMEVKCECEGAGFVAVADNGGDGVASVWPKTAIDWSFATKQGVVAMASTDS
jgi:hypothetical protein